MQWNPQQQEAIQARGQDLLVSAAAGSGKTAVLTARVLSLLRQGVRPEGLLVVTYTQAAAAQLRGRIARALEQEADVRIAAVAQELGRAKICTVHAFCTSLLREFFMQAGVEPMFRVLDAPQSSRLADQAQALALEEALENGGEGVFDLYARLGGMDSASQLARQFYEVSRSKPHSRAWRESQLDRFEHNAGAVRTSDWARALSARARRRFAQAANWTWEAAQACGGEKLRKNLEQQAAQLESRAREQDYDALFAPVAFARLSFEKSADPQEKETVKRLAGQAKDAVEEALAVPAGAALEADAQMVPALRALGALCDGFERAYEDLKARQGALDFSDLEHRALQALEDEAVRKAVRAQYEYVFVDEYQDANELQEAILRAVSRGDNRFMVGDVKQSIYSFRMAEPSLFLEKYAQFDGKIGKRIDLNANYRSSGAVLGFANHVFSQAMTPQTGGVAYDEAAALRPGRVLAGMDTRIVLARMDGPADEGTDDAGRALEELTCAQAEAKLIVREVRALLGTPVPDGDGARPAGYGDICILLRSPKTWGSTVTEALSDAGIPVTGDADGAYYDLSEVRTFLNLLFVLDNRRRDVALIGALTAPYGGFTPAELGHVRAQFRAETCSFFDACVRYGAQAEDDLARRLNEFLEKLLVWRKRARYTPPGAFVRDLLDESGYLSYAGTLPLGELRAENLRALAARADGYETLSDFLAVAALGDEGSGESGVAPAPQDARAVRILSIHRAKGLEFPLVILAGCGKRLNARDSAGRLLIHRRMGLGLRYSDEEQLVTMDTLSHQAVRAALEQDRISEEIRVLYVALTRPVVGLVITAAVRDLDKKLLRASEIARSGRYEDAVDFLDILLPPLFSHPDGEALRQIAPCPVRPVRYPCRFVLEEVPAWTLTPVVQERAQKSAEPDGTEADSWVDARLRWTYVPPEGALPRKLAVTRLARTEQEDGLPVPDFAREAIQGAPAAARGTALHALFAAVDPQALAALPEAERPAHIRAQYDRLCRDGVIGPREAASIGPAMAAAFYDTDLGRAVLGAPFVRREQPFNLIVPAEDVGQQDGRVMLQGVIDLYFRDGQGNYTVVDFKTGRLSAREAAARYASQVGFYVAALERMTGGRAQGYLYLADTGAVVRVV